MHLRPELMPHDDGIDLVVVQKAAPVEVRRSDSRPRAVDERGLGVQQTAVSAQALLIVSLAVFLAFISVFPLPFRPPWLLGCSLTLRDVFLV